MQISLCVIKAVKKLVKHFSKFDASSPCAMQIPVATWLQSTCSLPESKTKINYIIGYITCVAKSIRILE